MQTVGSAQEAQAAARNGTDVVVAQGWEAGGYVWGTVATMALVPAVIDAIAPVPVIAAGGIADGRGLAAALALGASGAWIGTRFLASSEATIHPHYRDRLLKASESDTVHLENLFDLNWPNAPHRVLRNKTAADWEAAGRPKTGRRPAKVKLSRPRSLTGKSSDTAHTPQVQMLKGILKLYRCGLDKASRWSGNSNQLLRSCTRFTTKHR